ncbi:139aa long hypothetical protein [Pyrococcus horikoshii OT3]|uniref:Uncharacterized protein n=1 Tax=Pyrococcus horikoshii (strain ATCC 700860 / DSM 12428 / JCM 9974 / NBRC 100139 / OT-3) TaxID=70601 RepID=O58386_PYRHO|nr:139aa long hypothetical protein [Pyrococcus horikoshii OT3]
MSFALFLEWCRGIDLANLARSSTPLIITLNISPSLKPLFFTRETVLIIPSLWRAYHIFLATFSLLVTKIMEFSSTYPSASKSPAIKYLMRSSFESTMSGTSHSSFLPLGIPNILESISAKIFEPTVTTIYFPFSFTFGI